VKRAYFSNAPIMNKALEMETLLVFDQDISQVGAMIS
jgi:hypothetical protein